jgi:glycopeptide antibiotics resistance protein
MKEKRNWLTLILCTVYLLALTWLILFKLQFGVPVMEEGRVINLIPLGGSFDDNGVLRLAEIRLNILAFIPLGIYIYMLKSNWAFVKKALAVFSLTLVFEITQFIFAIGRADITDILSNTLGGVIGMGLYALLFKVMKSKTNKVLNGLAAGLTISALLLAAFFVLKGRWVLII